MLKRTIPELLVLFLAIAILFLLLLVKDEAPVHLKEIVPEPDNNPTRIGEKITYDVSLGWIYLGQSVFTHLPDTQLKGKKVSQFSFETKIKGFYDLETIYSDQASLLPLQVTRKIKGWGFDERITEDYNQKDFSITFTKYKYKDGKEEVKIVKADCPLNNAVLFPFFIRKIPEPKVGWSMTTCIPQKFEVSLVGVVEINTPAGKCPAYYFKSKPNSFEVWISADERRVPLKIKSSGSTMVLKEYSFTKN